MSEQKKETTAEAAAETTVTGNEPMTKGKKDNFLKTGFAGFKKNWKKIAGGILLVATGVGGTLLVQSLKKDDAPVLIEDGDNNGIDDNKDIVINE